MTSPWGNPPQLPNPPRDWPITVSDPLCGHIGDEPHDDECAYWRGVVLGDYPLPEIAPVLSDPALNVWRPGPDMVEQMSPPLRWHVGPAGVEVAL